MATVITPTAVVPSPEAPESAGIRGVKDVAFGSVSAGAAPMFYQFLKLSFTGGRNDIQGLRASVRLMQGSAPGPSPRGKHSFHRTSGLSPADMAVRRYQGTV